MIANPCAPSARLNRTPRANVFILLFLSASFVPLKVQLRPGQCGARPDNERCGAFRDSTSGKSKATAFRTMFTPLTVRKIATPAYLSIFLYNRGDQRFRFGISELG